MVIGTAISMVAATALSAAEYRNERAYEADWYIADTTDNNTGRREVYAFQSLIKPDNFVTLKIRCTQDKPTFFVEWEDLQFPDQTVLTIVPTATGSMEAPDGRYVFEVSNDPVERGLRASPETSRKIVASIAQAKHVIVTAHLASGSRSVEMDVDGTMRAWERISRHCPVQSLPLPPR